MEEVLELSKIRYYVEILRAAAYLTNYQYPIIQAEYTTRDANGFTS